MWLLELLLIAYLPGALVFRLPVAERARRAALGADERAFWAVVISVAWSSLVVLALAAASQYTYPRLLVASSGLSALLLLGGRTRLLYGGTARRPGLEIVYPLVLAALGLWLFFPVSEYIIGGKDPGVYINEGVAIAQRGSLVIRDSLVAALPAPMRDLFFPAYGARDYYSIRFMGFFLVDPVQGTVVGQFPHLYPAWVAIGYGLDGLTGALRAIGACAVFGLLAVYFAAARVIGRPAACAAAGLLGVSLIEIWFARYPNSEIGVQALLFAGLLAFARSHVDEDGFFAPVAGVTLGLLLFLRFDAVLAWAGVGLAVVFLLFDGRRPRFGLIAPMLALAAGYGLYLSTWMRPYAERPRVFFENLQPAHLAAIAGGLVAVLALIPIARHRRVAAVVRRWLPHAISLLVVAAAIYAYFVRQPVGRLAAHDAYALRTFAWYFPAAGLAAALAGFVLLAWRRFWRMPTFFAVTTICALFVFYKIQIVPDHFWMTRRFLPVILPAACVLLAAAAFFSWWSRDASLDDTRSGQPTPRAAAPRLLGAVRVVLPVALVTIVGLLLIRASRPVASHVEYEGIIPHIEQLARRLGDRDLVIVEARRSSDLHVIALPLAYIYARNVLVLATPRPDRQVFQDFLRWARGRYDRVFFAGGGGTDLLTNTIAIEAVDSLRFQVPEYESVRNAYPATIRRKEFDFGLYRFVDAHSAPGTFDLDVGNRDDLHVVRFHAKERSGDQTFRWTTETSYVSILGIAPSTRTLTLWMGDGGRPAGAEPAVVSCWLDNIEIGQIQVRGGVQAYRLAVPAAFAVAAARREDPVLLKLVSSTWSPRVLLGSNDDRKLGVMLDRVRIE